MEMPLGAALPALQIEGHAIAGQGRKVLQPVKPQALQG
jgi:hypothetical protein